MSLADKVTAFFDVDGTLSETTVVHSFVLFKLSSIPKPLRFLWLSKLALMAPCWLLADLVSRSIFNKLFYANYAGVSPEELSSFARTYFESFWLRRLYLEAVQRIEWHRSMGHRIVLLTGAVDLLVKPLAEFIGADDFIAVKLEVAHGRFTGKLLTPPLSELQKAIAIREYASVHGLSLSQCYAYADSYSDRFALECVGHPVAVNPDLRLLLLAKRRGWQVERWRSKMSVKRSKPKWRC
jgi:HAD superfamily hydrolase (TIGR01490 family)